MSSVAWLEAQKQLPALRVPDALGVNIHFVDPKPGEMEMLCRGPIFCGADGPELGRDGTERG